MVAAQGEAPCESAGKAIAWFKIRRSTCSLGKAVVSRLKRCWFNRKHKGMLRGVKRQYTYFWHYCIYNI